MAQTQSSPMAVKRGPGRPSRAAQPPLKKVKASETPVQSSPSIQSPSVHSPAPSSGVNKLPTKLSEYRPLPTLPSPQPLSLPSSTYQSLAESAVLQASLDRSRLRWVFHGVFDRYWTKPETGKNARPPPPNNPEAKWMKHRGPCRIRVEPHIFECEVYVEEKPKPPVQKVPQQTQYGQGAYGSYGGQYRPGVGQGYGQQRSLPPMQQTPVRQSPAPGPPQRSQQNTPQQQPDKKAGPDPVISMLANRASSDPELKALMKEVATGAANPEQLRVFQVHIDELTKIIAEKKKKEEEETAAAEAKKAQQQQQESIQYDGAADAKSQQRSQTSPVYQSHQQQNTWFPPPPPAVYAPAPPQPPAAPPVILQFTTPGATEDRFLFPPKTILESLSPQHLLCSTLITRKGIAATDSSTLNPTTEYVQPVTFMVEVAYGRESLIELVKKFVKPAEEVRKHMEEVMARCTRAPEAHLALRLPVKGAEGAETEEERAEEEGKMAEEMKKRVGTGHGPNVKYVKKPGPKKGEGGRPVGVKNGEGGGKRQSMGAGAAKGGAAAVAGAQATPAPVPEKGKEEGTVEGGGKSEDVATANEGDATKNDAPGGQAAEKKDEKENSAVRKEGTEESGRPKRAVRKSVRISEG